ncbi:MAG: Cna B-type protein [Bryobacterales bacterium]|nr:Cna B-type protein [Bryobacterales bacterium]
MFSHSQQLCFALYLAFFLAASAWGQAGSGTIRGVVTDSSAAVLPGAQVTVTNEATNIVQQTETNDQGVYVVPFLSPGQYTITGAKTGMQMVRHPGVTLRVADDISIALTLPIGTASTEITVEATTPLVSANSASLGQVIENRRIVELPLDGRDPISLAGLAPGVVPVPPNTNIHQGGAIPSINGAANFTSEVTIDGVPDTTPRNSSINSFLIYTPTVDAVAEFKVETNSLSAQYGRFNGGVINVVLKSGTNQIHGSVYEFLRNSVMDANYFFNNRSGIPLPALKRNQFGFTLGGPVVLPHLYNGHNKTFFFVDYEGYRESLASTGSFTVPTALQRQGDFSQTTTSAGQLIRIYDPQSTTTVNGVVTRTAFAGNIIPTSRLDPVALALAKYYPLPNNTNLTNNYLRSTAVRFTDDTGDARIDHQFSDKNRFFGRYSIQYPFTGSPNNYGNIGTPDNPPLTQKRHAATLQDTYTLSPTLILEVNYGLVRQYGTRTAWSNGFDITTLGFAQNFAAAQQVKAIPGITISGMSGIGNVSQNYSTQFNHTLTGSLTKIAGNHTIKGGIDFRTYFINQLQNTQAEGGLTFATTYTQGPNAFQASALGGNGFASFLLGIPGGSIAIQPAVAVKSSYVAGYVQDDWKVTPKLTLNLGLRYDVSIPRTERYNRFSVFDPNAASPIAGQVPGFPNLKGALTFGSANSRQYADIDLNNFAPRIGFAYQITPATVVRAGYGIFYGLSPTDAAGPSVGFADGFTGSTTINTSLDGATPVVALSNPFPNGINYPASGSQLSARTNLGQSISSLNIGQATPYMQNWNVSVQRSLGTSVLMQVAYAGNKGTRLPFNVALNANSLTTDQYQAGAVNNQLVANPFYGIITDTTSVLSNPTVTRGQLLKPYPQYINLNAINATEGSSIYHSLQASMEKRFSKGFTVLAAFTAAKLIDNTTQAATGQTIGGVQDPTNLRAERSIDPQDVSRRLVISGVWELPIGRNRAFGGSMNRWADGVVGGWQLNGIASFSSGQPLVLTSIGVARPNVVGKPKDISGAVQNRLAQYFDITAYAVPVAFTYGNSSPTSPNLRAPGIANYDMSLFKGFALAEHIRAQLRFEAFNLFNRVQFAAPGTQTGSTSFGIISAQQNTPRELQVALKIIF